MTKKIIGQIIALTKNIYLVQPKEGNGYEAKFLVGKQDLLPFSGFGIAWWYTQKSFKLLENIAFMIISSIKQFSNCDYESIKNIIQTTLTEVCVDKRIFNGDDVCFAKKETLQFCMVSTDVKEHASMILEEIIINIKKNLTKWCVVYAIPRLTGESFSIESQRIHIINKMDKEYWNTLESKGYIINNWNPKSGCYDGRTTPFSTLKYDYIIVTEESGTLRGCKQSSSLKQKKVLSVIRSVINENREYKLQKSTADPYTVCIQFPHNTSSHLGITMSGIGGLFPYYCEDLPIRSGDIKKVIQWYKIVENLQSEAKNRIDKCAHFLNHAMNSNDIESYINYFISLDALFGERGAVENSICEGVSKLPQKSQWNEKISWLFDFRNELVHGGSRYIKECPQYMRYYLHFSSKPSDDIESLAFNSLYNAPFIFTEAPQ